MKTRTKIQLTVFVTFVAIGINLLSRAAPTKPTPTPKVEKSLLYPETQKAKNPTKLQLLLDHRKVIGWISGNQSFANREVIVKHGDKTSRVKVNQENSFTYPYEVTQSEMLEFSIDKLQASVRVTPRPKLEPAVFFVVDRTVYRPGHTLNFAAFLRQPDEQGIFQPVANRNVEVHLTSKRKNTLATKMELTSDDFGRVTGSYAFTEGDPLDTYELAIPGFEGTAEIKQAEFRKAKVKLKISGELKDDKMDIHFQGIDFLNNPVKASMVRFTLQVVKKQKEEKEFLNTKEFAYHSELPKPSVDLDRMSDEQRLLWEAGYIPGMQFHVGSGQVLFHKDHQLTLKDAEPGKFALPINPQWLKDDHIVLVKGVLTDENGREQRASQVLPLEKNKSTTASKAPRTLRLKVPRRYYGVNEPISVQVEAVDDKGNAVESQAAIVAMGLTPGQQQVNYGYYRGFGGWNQLNPYHWQGINTLRFAQSGAGWNPRLHGRRGQYLYYPQTTTSSVERSMVSAVPVVQKKAQVKLDKPGAYKLVAIAHLKDGRKLQKETGIVIRGKNNAAALTLSLNKKEIANGEPLTGEIHSRFRDAKLLLIVRDGQGIRLWKPLQMQGNVLRLNESLPEDLRYVSSIEVQYQDEEGELHLASELLKVRPEAKMLKVKATMPKICEPGKKIKINLEVNRKEKVDLVVSVYDQSLLGIAPDKSTDIRSFFFADDRVRVNWSQELIRRQIGNVRVSTLVAKARELMKKAEKDDPELSMWNALSSDYKSKYLYSRDVLTLLRLAGVNAFPRFQSVSGTGWYYQFSKKTKEQIEQMTLAEVLAGERRNTVYILPEFHQNVLLLWEFYKGQEQALYQSMNHFGGYGGRARGDAFFSLSGNGVHSISGQSLMSHMPATPVQVLDVDPQQSGISVRRNFSDSAFWNAQIRTDDQGKAKVEFVLPDSLTNWQVVVTAISKEMHVGHAKSQFRTFKPVMVWPMIPRIFTEGDKVKMFARVHNRSDQDQIMRVKAKVDNGELLTDKEVSLTVKAKSSETVYWTYKVGKPGFTQILMTAECDQGSDASLKRLPVTRMAAEQSIHVSGSTDKSSTIEVPTDVDLSGANLEIRFAPTLAADLVDTLEYLVEYPHGCVEQTMSRFVPVLKVAQTLDALGIEHKELTKKLPKFVEAGVKRLLQLQRGDGGWGWHGNGQTHEMMTPYALYGLLESEKAGYPIPNEQAIARGIVRLKQFINAMNERQAADRIYCMYVYSHRQPIEENWWKFIDQQLDGNLSDYALALALEMAVKQNKAKLAESLAKRLRAKATKREDHVFWTTARFSRWGDNRHEITAAVLKALVAYDVKDPLIPGILNYFNDTKNGNRWGSTKDTAMIIYALCDYVSKKNLGIKKRQSVTFTVNDGKARKVTFDSPLSKTVTIPGKELKHGKNTIRFVKATPGVMVRASFNYWKSGAKLTALSNGIDVAREFYHLKGNQRIRLKSGDSVPRGAHIESRVIAKNSMRQMRYILVKNPKASCCEILPENDPRYHRGSTQYVLREEKTEGVFYHHEQTSSTIYDTCVVHAELSGEYNIPPAYVELMYKPEMRGHSGSFTLKVGDPKE